MAILNYALAGLMLGGLASLAITYWRQTVHLRRELERWRSANERLAALYETAVGRDNEARRAIAALLYTLSGRDVANGSTLLGDAVQQAKAVLGEPSAVEAVLHGD